MKDYNEFIESELNEEISPPFKKWVDKNITKFADNVMDYAMKEYEKQSKDEFFGEEIDEVRYLFNKIAKEMKKY